MFNPGERNQYKTELGSRRGSKDSGKHSGRRSGRASARSGRSVRQANHFEGTEGSEIEDLLFNSKEGTEKKRQINDGDNLLIPSFSIDDCKSNGDLLSRLDSMRAESD